MGTKYLYCGNKILYWGNNILFSRMALFNNRNFAVRLRNLQSFIMVRPRRWDIVIAVHLSCSSIRLVDDLIWFDKIKLTSHLLVTYLPMTQRRTCVHKNRAWKRNRDYWPSLFSSLCSVSIGKPWMALLFSFNRIKVSAELSTVASSNV